MTEPAEDPPAPAADTASHLAAVDLGSNSFHLVIARPVHGELAVLDRHREQVQLARGLTRSGRIGKRARRRALACLERFRERLRAVPAHRVRAVGTNTLRRARDAAGFLDEARQALGHPVEVIPGREEARLIYLGVAHGLPDDHGPRLVVDVGGGSTEVILGEGFEPLAAHSLGMGCVGMTREFFPDGAITKEAMKAADLAARLELRTIQEPLRSIGWERAVGASGTVRAAEAVLEASGFNDRGITAKGLQKLRKAMVTAGHAERLALPGLKADRAPVFAGGVAILLAVFRSLDIERMEASAGALREGVMYDLQGRIQHEDVRERTIRNVQERYHVDRAQAARVERTALALLLHAPPEWGLEPAEDGRTLAWAARLHEIGLDVAYSGYHRHGAYLLAHSDLPGFSRDDQRLLAAVVACHRRKIEPGALDDLPPARRTHAERLVAILRLAVLLHRGRGSKQMPVLRLALEGDELVLRFPPGWLDRHPLTRADLEEERKRLRALGLTFAGRA